VRAKRIAPWTSPERRAVAFNASSYPSWTSIDTAMVRFNPPPGNGANRNGKQRLQLVREPTVHARLCSRTAR